MSYWRLALGLALMPLVPVAAAPKPVTAATVANVAAPLDPARLELGRQLVAAMGMEDGIRRGQLQAFGSSGEAIFDKMVPAQLVTQLQLTNSRGLAAARAALAPTLLDSIQSLVEQLVPITVDAAARRYAAHFTPDELRQLIAVYKSPIGLRLVAETLPMAIEDNQFQQSVTKGLIQSKAAELLPKIMSQLAPLIRQGSSARPAPEPRAMPL